MRSMLLLVSALLALAVSSAAADRPLPITPPQFSVNIEINLADEMATVNMVEYYDRVNNRVRIDQTRAFGGGVFAPIATQLDNSGALHAVQQYLLYDQNLQYIVVDGTRCFMMPISAAERRRRIDPATGRLDARDFDFTTSWMHDLNWTYVGNDTTARAINVDQWAAPYVGAISNTTGVNLTVDFFFSVAQWHTIDHGVGVDQVPVALELNGYTYWLANGSVAGAIKHRFVYTSLLVPRAVVDPMTGLPGAVGFDNSTFTPPSDAHCPMLPALALPNTQRHRSFIVNIEINKLEMRQTSAVTESYDFEGGRVRIDRYTATAGLILSDIYDYSAGVWTQFQTSIDPATGVVTPPTCFSQALSVDPTRYNSSSGALVDSNFDFFVLQSSDLNYIYTGQEFARGIMADVWSTRYRGNYLQYNASLNVEWAFTPHNGWGSYAINVAGSPVPVRIRVRGVGTDSAGKNTTLEHYYEYSNFVFTRPPGYLFQTCNSGAVPLPGSSGLSDSALAGAVIGSIVGGVLLAALGVHCYYRRRIARGDFSRLDDAKAPHTTDVPPVPVTATAAAAPAPVELDAPKSVATAV